MIYVENPEEATIKVLVLIKEFDKVAGYKLIYRNLLHFYISIVDDWKDKLQNNFIYYYI